MKQISLGRVGWKLALLAILVLPELANAQSDFNYNSYGDVLVGFRKTGSFAGKNEMVVDIGSVTNLLKLSIGTTINITQYSPSVLTAAFIDTASSTDVNGYGDLQWSVFSAFPGGISPWVTPLGSFPKDTLWYTLPAANVSTQTTPPLREEYGSQQATRSEMNGVGTGAAYISDQLSTTNAENNTLLVVEPINPYGSPENGTTLSSYIGDGNFDAGGSGLPYDVENITPDDFNSAERDDLYQMCPSGYTDPITGTNNGNGYFVGYFILNTDGSMSFTRAAQATGSAAPVAAFSGGPTAGFAGFQAVFTDQSTGTITNWVWNFGNGTSITNTTDASVTNTYASGGDYNVTLTVSGPGGVNDESQPNFIMVSPVPTIHVSQAAGNPVLGGTNCPVGVQYRVLESTNLTLPLAGWTPVVTNTFLGDGSWSYTSTSLPKAAFYRLVSP